MPARYTIEGGHAGKDRLDVLHRVHGPHTRVLLDLVGVPEGARCLDVGCGGGHVSRELARRVGLDGSVIALDLDATVLERAGADAAAEHIANVEFRCADATELDESDFDVAYARFLLSHVGESSSVLPAMVAAVKPGGVVIVEDTDFTGSFCYPRSAAFERWVALYRETVRKRGGNPDVGQMLPSLLDASGLEDVGIAVRQPCSRDGDVKVLNALTIERIAESVQSEGVASAEEVAEVATEVAAYCADPTTLVSTPRVVQSWGRKPRSGDASTP